MQQPSKSPLLLTALAVLGLGLTLFITSCGTPEGSVLIPIPKDSSALSKIDHFISEGQIKEYRAAFATENDSLQRAYPSLLLPASEAFNKPAILAILKDPRCVGIRIYHGVKKGGKRNEVRQIIVGVDSEGKDILITKGSALAAQADGTQGGVENGQCPTCQTNQ
jgi:hypothetical protein